MARKMKDSGIEWIGEIPEGWEVTKLKYLSTFPIEKNAHTDSPYIGLENIESWTGKYVSSDSQYDKSQALAFFENNILFGKLRPYLAKVFCASNDGCCSSEFCILNFSSSVNIRYFWNLLISPTFIDHVTKSTYGTKMPRANTDFIKNICVPVPPRIEQDRIALYLDATSAKIDSLISETRSSIEEYKKLKQAVITQAVTEGTPAMFSSPHSVKLKYLISIVSGEAIRNEQLSDFGEYPVYGGGEIIGFCSQYNTSEGSLIIGRVGARCGCVTHTTCKSWATDNALIVLPTCNAKYMYYVIGHCQLNNLNTSNAQPLITSTKIKNVVVPYFSDAMQQQEIADYLDAKCAEIDGLIAKKEQLVKELESYKKSLIYEVVTGKREV